MVPYTAKHARGRNLSMDVDVRAKKRDGILKTDVRRDILPALQELRTEFVAHSASLRNHCLLEKDTLEDLAAAMGELEERHQLSESKLRRAEESYKREREVLDQAAEVHAKVPHTLSITHILSILPITHTLSILPITHTLSIHTIYPISITTFLGNGDDGRAVTASKGHRGRRDARRRRHPPSPGGPPFPTQNIYPELALVDLRTFESR